MEPIRLLDEGGPDEELALLRAARSERPDEGARRRTIAALGTLAGVTAVGAQASAATATPLLLGLGKWLGAGALLGVVSAGSLHVLSTPASVAHAPREQETSVDAKQTPREVTPVSRPTPAAAPSASETVARELRTSAERSVPPASALEQPSTLAEERALLERARAALSSGSTGEAARLLSRHGASFPGGALGDEARVLRIELALARGQTSLAVSLADALLASSPNGAHAARVRGMRQRALGSDR
jgi:hypothetical protein